MIRDLWLPVLAFFSVVRVAGVFTAEQVSDCHAFWRHFRFRSPTALAQVLRLTITTKNVTLRIRRVVSSTAPLLLVLL